MKIYHSLRLTHSVIDLTLLRVAQDLISLLDILKHFRSISSTAQVRMVLTHQRTVRFSDCIFGGLVSTCRIW
jgi:hypothetical protein